MRPGTRSSGSRKSVARGKRRATEGTAGRDNKYRSIIEQSTDGFLLFDGRGAIADCNPALGRILGIEPSEWIGRPLQDLMFHTMPDRLKIPETYERIKADILNASRQGFAPWFNKPMEMEIRRPDGEERTLQITTFPIRTKSGDHYCSIIRDVTDMRGIVRALAEREETLRVLAETSAAAICLYQDERFVYVNPAVERISGYSKEEFQGKCIWDVVPAVFRENLRAQMAQRTKGATVPSRFEMQFIAKGGEARWIDVSIGQVDLAGKPLYMASAFDITERKQAEDLMRKAKAEAELYVDLMGHDINNMNQIAMGYLELANNVLEMQGSLDRAQQFLITRPIETLLNNSNLIRNVRKLQREKAGDYAYGPVEINAVLGEVVAQFTKVPGRDVRIHLESCTCTVIANELLKDVFQNLIGNAIKHSAGPLEIGIKAEQVGECGGSARCRVTVEDNGPGIPDAEKKRLFDRLSLEKTRAAGRGFGLCLSKMLIDDFGGRFCVEDRVMGDYTQGAKFVVVLPAVDI